MAHFQLPDSPYTGHKDWSMIIRRYGRWMPDADDGAGSGAEAV